MFHAKKFLVPSYYQTMPGLKLLFTQECNGRHFERNSNRTVDVWKRGIQHLNLGRFANAK